MALVQTCTLFYLYEFYLVSTHCAQGAGWSARTALRMGALQTLPRGAARGNAPLVLTFASAPAHCYGSCGHRTFAHSVYYEYTYARTAGFPTRIRLVHVADGPFCPLAPGHIGHSVGGTEIKQFPNLYDHTIWWLSTKALLCLYIKSLLWFHYGVVLTS